MFRGQGDTCWGEPYHSLLVHGGGGLVHDGAWDVRGRRGALGLLA